MSQTKVSVALARSVALTTLMLCLVGCLSQHSGEPHAPLGVADALGLRAYFRSLKPGYPLSRIEAELSLREPIETRAPASDWPFWKYLYKTGDYYIRIWVDGSGPGRKDMVFQGEWYVYTEEEYHKARIPTP
jgi:hypothetical protein